MEGRGRASATIHNQDSPSSGLDASPNLLGQRATQTRELGGETGLWYNGYAPTMACLDSNETLMICRRFGVIHARVFVKFQYENRDLEQGLYEPDNLVSGYQPNRFVRRRAPENSAERRLLRTLETHLSEYSSKISSMKSLRRISKPPIHRDQSVRDWISFGPPIHIDPSDIIGFGWKEYSRAVIQLLNDPTHSDWLDKPGFAKQALEDLGRDEGYDLKRVRDKMLLIGGILCWIFHITAAIAYFLIPSSLESKEKSSTVILCRWLLGYWFASATVIVVSEILAKGHIYIRKVFLGGLAAFSVGFYVLIVLLHIPATSAKNGLPTLFTIVLGLIKFG